jgi:hypothetical protein
MKFDLRIIASLGIQEPLTLRKVNEMTIFIFSDVARFESGEVLQFLGVFTGNPTSFIIRY